MRMAASDEREYQQHEHAPRGHARQRVARAPQARHIRVPRRVASTMSGSSCVNSTHVIFRSGQAGIGDTPDSGVASYRHGSVPTPSPVEPWRVCPGSVARSLDAGSKKSPLSFQWPCS